MRCCQATEAGVQSELSKLSKKEKNRIFDLRGKVSPFFESVDVRFTIFNKVT